MNTEAKHKPVTYETPSSVENTLAAIYQPIRHELSLVEKEIADICAYMRQAGSHPEPLQTGGKRIRPALLLLSSLFGKEQGQDAIRLAAAVEILHLATLIHDDLIDESSYRRGKPTINKQWGNNAAVLAGDYLYALLLEYTAGYDKSIITALATALRNMVQAELLQLNSQYNCDITEKDYIRRIFFKTGSFLSCCCVIGAILSGAPVHVQRTLERYGCFIGIAFQLKDDLLDFQGNMDYMGKPVAQDLKQGVLTLPVIYALKYSPEKKLIRSLIENKNITTTHLREIVKELANCGALSYSLDIAERYIYLAGKALAALPANEAKKSLEALLDFVILREK